MLVVWTIGHMRQLTPVTWNTPIIARLNGNILLLIAKFHVCIHIIPVPFEFEYNDICCIVHSILPEPRWQQCWGLVTYWSRGKMMTILQMTFSNPFSWMKFVASVYWFRNILLLIAKFHVCIHIIPVPLELSTMTVKVKYNGVLVEQLNQ